jgi:hypothetical protein
VANLPSVEFTYRHCLPIRTYEFSSQKQRGHASAMDAIEKLFKEYLLSWDVADDIDESKVAALKPEAFRKTPAFILDHIADSICGYIPEQAAADAKNSVGASA